MTADELEQFGKIIESKLKAEREYIEQIIETKLKAERKHTQKLIEGSEKRIKTELTVKIKDSAEELANDMADFFHKTWEEMQKTNDRVTIIEDHLDLPHRTGN